MNIFINSSILALSIAALWWGAVLVVDSASRIAQRMGISELVIGLTIVAFGTSAPEFAVTLTAAFKGQADISVGNVVGSNVFNLGFILGGIAIIRAIKTTPKLVYRDGSILIGASVLLLIFLWDSTIERWEGLVLMTALLGYLILLFRQKESLEEEVAEGVYSWKDIPLLIAGLLLIVAGGHFLVDAAIDIARALGISEWVIAVTIVAAGTSTPELATSLVAVIKGKHSLSAGNLIGSDLFNLLGVLGLAAIIHPMKIDSGAYEEIVMLAGLVFLVVIMMRSGWKISRTEGIILVIVNLIRWYINFSK